MTASEDQYAELRALLLGEEPPPKLASPPRPGGMPAIPPLIPALPTAGVNGGDAERQAAAAAALERELQA